MKKIFKYLGIALSAVLMGAFTSCNIEDISETENVGLGIKVFFPTKVVAGQPMTINGSGFAEATAVVFPGGVSVTDFEIVSGEMIRVTAPAGIAAEGGKIVVRTAQDEVESNLPLTLGHPAVNGYSKQPGETAQGGELITVYGTDLEFINEVELLDADGNPNILQGKDLYRVGTSSVVISVPRRNIYNGTFAGKIRTYNGQEFTMPELAYEPAADGGHWETVKNVIWEEDGTHGAVSWSGAYRFCLEGHDYNNECCAEFPQDIWTRLQTETFYLDIEATDPQVRVTNGHWSVAWNVGDIQPGNERITDNGDGTWTVEINLSEDADFLATLEEKHLLFTGDRFTPIRIYFYEEEWVEGEAGHFETVKTAIWEEDGTHGAVSWSGAYRFCLEGHDYNNECCAEFPQDIWTRLQTETFYLDVEATDPQVRVTNGHWSVAWNVGDIQPGNERITDNGDGTWTVEINISEDADLLATLEEKHLLFTGDRFTPIRIYFYEEVWIEGGGGDTPSNEIVLATGNWEAMGWGNQPTILASGALGEAGAKAGQILRIYVTANEGWGCQITSGWWTMGTGKHDFAGYDLAGHNNAFEIVLDDEDISLFNTEGIVVNADGIVVTKVTLE